MDACVVDKDMFASEFVVRVHRSELRWVEVPMNLIEKRPVYPPISPCSQRAQKYCTLDCYHSTGQRYLKGMSKARTVSVGVDVDALKYYFQIHNLNPDEATDAAWSLGVPPFSTSLESIAPLHFTAWHLTSSRIAGSWSNGG